MATTNPRDVPLTVSVTTVGTDSVQDLQAEVRKLAKEGGDAAPAFEELGNEIAKLGEQSKVVAEARDLTNEIERLGVVQAQTAQRSRELGDQLAVLNTNTGALAEQERLAKTALMEGQRALFDKRQALASLKNETSAADKESANYTRQVKALNAEIISGKTQVRDLAEAHRAAKAATSEAAAEETKLARSAREAAAELRAAEGAVKSRTTALDQARQQMRDSSLATDNLAQAEVKLLQTYVQSVGTLDNIRVARDRAAQAAKQAAREEEDQAIRQLYRRKELEAQARAEADGILRDYARMEQASRDAADAAVRAASEMNNAFRTVGTRSVEELRGEIDRVRNALDLLKTSGTLVGGELNAAFASGERRVRELEREIRAATGQVTLMDRASAGLKSTFGQFAAGFGAVEVIQRLGGAFVTANLQLERLRLGLGTIYKSTDAASAQIDFLRRSANEAGVSVGAITDSFVKFTASTTSANIPIEQTNALFAAITRAAGTLGLSGDKVNLMLDALSQIAGKGVVSMEELRQQLGDSLPGALSLTAKGLGLTDAELIKLVESGGLLARDLFPALTRSLKTLGAEVNTTGAIFERFKNALTESAQTAGDAGWTEVMRAGLKALAVAVGLVVIPLSALTEIVFGLARAAGVLAGSIATLTNPLQALSELVDNAANRQARLIEAFDAVTGASDAAAASVTRNNTATIETAPAQASAAVAIAATAQAHQTSAGAATSNAQAQTLAGQAALVGGQGAAVAGQSWERLGIRYKEGLAASEQAIVNANKLARAKELEGQSLVTLAELTGNEARALEASAFAALGHANALGTVVQQRQAEIASMTGTAEALQRESELRGDPDGSRAKFIEEIYAAIEARNAELEKSTQMQIEMQREADARSLAVQTYKDNSAALDELRNAMELAKETERQVAAAVRDGWLEKERATVASRNAALAEGLYRDALEDTAAASQRATQVIRDRTTVLQAGVNVDIARSRASEAVARAMGNETLVGIEQIRQKELEVKTTNLAIEAKRQEATEIIRSTTAQLESLRASGDLTPAKQAELESRLANARAMQLEADASQASVRGLEAEIDALRRNTAERKANTAAKVEAAAADERFSSPLGADKFSRPKGGSVTGNTREERLAGQGAVDNSLQFTLRDKLQSGTLTADDLGSLQAVVSTLKTNEAVDRSVDRLSPGLFSLQGMQDRLEWQRLRVQFEQYIDLLGGTKGDGGSAKVGGIYRVDLSTNNGTTSVNVNSQADADALVSALTIASTRTTR